jgi:hypothetical protein
MARTVFWTSSVLILTFAVLAGPAAAQLAPQGTKTRERQLQSDRAEENCFMSCSSTKSGADRDRCERDICKAAHDRCFSQIDPFGDRK